MHTHMRIERARAALRKLELELAVAMAGGEGGKMGLKVGGGGGGVFSPRVAHDFPTPPLSPDGDQLESDRNGEIHTNGDSYNYGENMKSRNYTSEEENYMEEEEGEGSGEGEERGRFSQPHQTPDQNPSRVQKSSTNRQRNATWRPEEALEGESVVVRCSRGRWHLAEIVRIGQESVRLWVPAVSGHVDVPIHLAGSNVAYEAPFGGMYGSAVHSVQKVQKAPKSREGRGTSPGYVKAPVHAVRPAHLAHRQLYKQVAVEISPSSARGAPFKTETEAQKEGRQYGGRYRSVHVAGGEPSGCPVPTAMLSGGWQKRQNLADSAMSRSMAARPARTSSMSAMWKVEEIPFSATNEFEYSNDNSVTTGRELNANMRNLPGSRSFHLPRKGGANVTSGFVRSASGSATSASGVSQMRDGLPAFSHRRRSGLHSMASMDGVSSVCSSASPSPSPSPSPSASAFSPPFSSRSPSSISPSPSPSSSTSSRKERDSQQALPPVWEKEALRALPLPMPTNGIARSKSLRRTVSLDSRQVAPEVVPQWCSPPESGSPAGSGRGERGERGESGHLIRQMSAVPDDMEPMSLVEEEEEVRDGEIDVSGSRSTKGREEEESGEEEEEEKDEEEEKKTGGGSLWSLQGQWLSVVKDGQDTRPKDMELENWAAFKEGKLGGESQNPKGREQWVLPLKRE